MDKELNLPNVVIIGRTFDEYFRLFAMDDIATESEQILDVASGASSFCAEANSKGYNVTASDKMYALDAQQIECKCNQDLDIILKQVLDVSDLYV
jgi:2-polyprenyl-3-methyl-5-hydroxy-6-metoxy-1,4-benzoquinol methylase